MAPPRSPTLGRRAPGRVAALGLLTLAASTLLGCATVTTVRLQAEAIEAGPGLRPIAGIQADATSAYILFIPVPGGVTLDRVVNQMLVATAKAMGADKIAHLSFDITPEGGVWALRKLAGWRTARASGIAVQVTALPPDPEADLGPEAPPAGP
ncbi:hypothetical protein [Haliangium sp.]